MLRHTSPSHDRSWGSGGRRRGWGGLGQAGRAFSADSSVSVIGAIAVVFQYKFGLVC